MTGTARPGRRSCAVTILIAAHVLGFAPWINALVCTRTVSGTVAWVIALNTFPSWRCPPTGCSAGRRFAALGHEVGNNYRAAHAFLLLGHCLHRDSVDRESNAEVADMGRWRPGSLTLRLRS
jgi:hypothetical protein